MHVIVTKEARKDLIAIHGYIRGELFNESAARRIMSELKKSIQRLEQFPAQGRSLDVLLPVHTDYRYLVCENHCIFYLFDETSVVIVRILHQRQDYLKALLMLDVNDATSADKQLEEE